MGLIIKWDEDKFDVGVELFNKHHKRLVDLLNLLHSVIDSTNNKKHVEIIFNELAKYTVYHFEAEEKAMEMYNYNHFALHQIEHKKFVSTVVDSIERYKQGITMVEVIKLLDFLREWIINHILKSDMKYKEFFKEHPEIYED